MGNGDNMECHPPSPLPSRCVFLPSHLAITPPRRYLARITLPRPFLPATQPPTLSADGLENTDAGVQHAVGAVHEAKVWPRDRHVQVQQGQVPEGRREEGAGGGGSRGKGDARGLKTQVISTVHSQGYTIGGDCPTPLSAGVADDLRSQLRAGQRSPQNHIAQGVADEGEGGEGAARGAGMGLEEFRHLLCEALPHVLEAVACALLTAGPSGTERGEGEMLGGREGRRITRGWVQAGCHGKGEKSELGRCLRIVTVRWVREGREGHPNLPALYHRYQTGARWLSRSASPRSPGLKSTPDWGTSW